MFDRLQGALAAARVRPGSGAALPRFRWWQTFGRSLRTIRIAEGEGSAAEYAVDVRRGGDASDGDVRARLYRDGVQIAVSRVPARFPVPSGRIEVAVGTFGMRRCHLVRGDDATPLAPHPASAEGRRARLHRERPAASRALGIASTTAVLVGLGVAVPQLVETITAAPPIADTIGAFDSPIDLPLVATLLIGAAAIAGSTERALRLRSGWLDDLAS